MLGALFPGWTRDRTPAPAEARAAETGYTAQLTAAFAAAAEAPSAEAPTAVAALETAAGWWSRGLASATVTGDRGALTPSVLALIGRDLCRRGESTFRIDVRAGRLVLAPLGFTYAHGDGPDPERWVYSTTAYGPTDSEHAWLPAARVAHFRHAVSADRPSLGVPPWAWAPRSGALAAWLERRLAEEVSASTGRVVPVPDQAGDAGDDPDTDPLAALKADFAKMGGKTLLVETTAAGWGDGRTAAPQSDWKPRRIGAEPPAVLAQLRGDLADAILGACGVPPGLTRGGGEAAGLREAFRVFAHGTLSPIGKLIAEEASRKLDSDVSLTFGELGAADIQGRARAYKALVDGGMDPDRAARACGIE